MQIGIRGTQIGRRPRLILNVRAVHGFALAAIVVSTDARSQEPAEANAIAFPPRALRRFDEASSEFKVTGHCRSCHNQPDLKKPWPHGEEWVVWWDGGKGPHARAYNVLSEERSAVMAQLLYGPETRADQRAECLGCHALNAAPHRRATERFTITEGVQCESCHGPAEHWQTPHQFTDWEQKSTAQRERLGMFDLRPLVRRAERCLECHLGDRTKRVTHDMLAAGHPELTLELATDCVAVPRHWADDRSFLTEQKEDSASFQARLWAVGQAVALREFMRQLLDAAEDHPAPDYALFECAACHHDIVAGGPNWRQRRRLRPDGPAAMLGEPPIDPARWRIVRSLVRVRMPDQLRRFDDAVERLGRSISPRRCDAGAVREAAGDLGRLAHDAANRFANDVFDESARRELMVALAMDGGSADTAGFRAAEQAFRGLYVLHVLSRSGSFEGDVPPDELMAALGGLGRALTGMNVPDDASPHEAFQVPPSGYDARTPDIERAWKKIRERLNVPADSP